ncbi:MAG TPA: thioredoxin domain-containing protein [Terriglobales bacterium]|jgi:protein-disulfide isomerase
MSRITTAFVHGILLSALAVLAVAQAPKDSELIAEVNGEKLTRADFEHLESSKLLQARYQYYEAERKAVDDLIDQRLLEQQARQQGLAVDQLLEREITAKLQPDPTEDQIRIYYEGMETDKTYEEMRDKIRTHIHDVRLNKAKAAYLVSLRQQSKIMVDLEPPSALVNVANSPVRGNKEAPILLVEFADYQCPYCQKVNADLGKLKQEFGDRLALVYKDFPLPMHPNAQKAAEAARCADAQGKFWEYHDLLFSEKKLEVSDLKLQARKLSLNGTSFDQCLDSGEKASLVQRDADEGKRLGLSGTPSFFLNGHFFSGALTYAALRDMVAQQLQTASLSPNKGASATESSTR